jgi:serine/threonine protein kinase
MHKTIFVSTLLLLSSATQSQWNILDHQVTLESLGCSNHQTKDNPIEVPVGPLREGVLPENFIDDGTFGSIYEGKCGGKSCAIKRARNTEDTIREIYFLKFLKDVARIPRVSACEVYTDEIYFAMNLYHTDMHTSKARNDFHQFNDFKKRLRIYEGLAETLSEIHKKKVVHSDIKPENLMALNAQYSSLHLIDFNTAFYNGEDHRAGTPGFESYNFVNNPLEPTLPADDIWALIITIAEIEFNDSAVANYLYHSCSSRFDKKCYDTMIKMLKSKNDLRFKMIVVNNGCPFSVADEFGDLITNSLDKKPENRPTATDLVYKFNAMLTACFEYNNGQSEGVSIQNDSKVNRPKIQLDLETDYFYPRQQIVNKAKAVTNLASGRLAAGDALIKNNDSGSISESERAAMDLNIQDAANDVTEDWNDSETQGYEYQSDRRQFADQPLHENPIIRQIQNSNPILQNPMELFKRSRAEEFTQTNVPLFHRLNDNNPSNRNNAITRMPTHGIEPAPTLHEAKRMMQDIKKIQKPKQDPTSKIQDPNQSDSSKTNNTAAITAAAQKVAPQDTSASKSGVRQFVNIPKREFGRNQNLGQQIGISGLSQVNRILAEANRVGISRTGDSMGHSSSNSDSGFAKMYI